MLYRCESEVNEVSLFCVVKKAGIVEAERSVPLRRAFDQRRCNLRWRAPPCCAMGAVGAMSFWHALKEMKEDGGCMTFGTRGLPDFCYPSDRGEAGCSCFVLSGVRSADVLEIIWLDVCVDRSGDYVVVGVALMCSLWACWTAQTTMDSRLHKEDCAEKARRIGGDSEGSRRVPYQDKMWRAVAGFSEIVRSRWELSDAVANIIGILSCGFLIPRGALIVLSEVDSWCSDFHGADRRRLPEEVLRRRAMAAAVVPPVSGGLAVTRNSTGTMFDAFHYGGAILATRDDLLEVRGEARLALRGGWLFRICVSSSCSVQSESEGEAHRRRVQGVELGTRVRVPSVCACWDYLATGKERVRWR